MPSNITDITQLPRMEPEQLSAVNWAETYWHRYNKMPTAEQIGYHFPSLSMEEFFAHPAVKRAFHNRGMKLTSNTSLSEEQAAAVLTVANWSDRRTIPAKLRSLGISTTKWNGWKKDKHFKEFLHSQLAGNLEENLERAHAGLLVGVDKGDTNAIKYYMELTGRAPSPVETNFKLAVSRIIESITRHVQSPEIIRAISQDFEMIMAGQDPNILSLPHSEMEI